MSIGGPFQLITNTGIQDKLIYATSKLLQQVNRYGCKKLSILREQYPGKTDEELLKIDQSWIPAINYIERTHIVHVNGSYKPFVALAHEYSKTLPSQGKPALGNTFSFTLPIIGDFINDCVVYMKLKNFSAVSSLDKVRYVEFPGHRILKRTGFKIKNTELDFYTSDNYTAHYQYKVQSNKEAGYLRNIGQEIPKQGYLTADPTVDEVREYRWFGDGAQTFKQTQSDLELWIPLLFWFKDVQCSLPNFLLPKNQTDIEIQLESEANMVAFADYSGSGGAYNAPTISECYLYANHLFMLPEISKIFVRKFGLQLIRVHRNQVQQLTDSDRTVLLKDLKWPVEAMYFGFRPKSNLANSQKWYRNTFIVDRTVKEAIVTGVATVQVNNAIYLEERHPVSQIELRCHDISIYPLLPPSFYQSYVPFRYGQNQNTPKNLGWYYINFNQTPGEHQPSGHLNTSRGRELYLRYISDVNPDDDLYYIKPSTPYDLLVLAECINFLLSDGTNAILKFST